MYGDYLFDKGGKVDNIQNMWKSFTHLLGYIWNNSISFLGTTTPAIIIFVVIRVVVFLINFIRHPISDRESGVSMKDTIKGRILSKGDTFITIGVTLVIWLLFFGWSGVNFIYTDHNQLLSRISFLKHERNFFKQKADQLKNDNQRLVKTENEKQKPIQINLSPPTVIVSPKPQQRYINSKELALALNGNECGVAAIWNDGTVEPQTFAVDLENGLRIAGWQIVGGGQKLGDAEFFPDSFSIEVSSIHNSNNDHAIEIAENLNKILKLKFNIDSKVHYNKQEFPPNFLKIKVAGR